MRETRKLWKLKMVGPMHIVTGALRRETGGL